MDTMPTYYETADELMRQIARLGSKLEKEGEADALACLKEGCQYMGMILEQQHLRAEIRKVCPF